MVACGVRCLGSEPVAGDYAAATSIPTKELCYGGMATSNRCYDYSALRRVKL